MAKLRPTLTLAEMEEEMGFRLSEVSSSMTTTGRLYSNLRPVSSDLYERTEKEHEEFVRRRKRAKRDSAKGISCISLRPGESESVICGDDSIRLSHDGGAGSYRFLVDIHYGFGLNLALLFSEAEAARVLSTAKLHNPTAATRNPTRAPAFFNLPLEIRQKIYIFALPRGIWRMVDDEDFERDNFLRGIRRSQRLLLPTKQRFGGSEG
ncbi:hypothetical protein GE09DRAFT_87148 [Coniochaeta sp. 2T2.1]|nr:hypothetical protein GE09DRAFT_87148 [Coniochaeta sp. 2T2.1]